LYELGRKDMTEYICIDSDYGHDAFLVEYEKFDFYVKKALAEEI
jgi:homoserine O-acetyltransferase